MANGSYPDVLPVSRYGSPVFYHQFNRPYHPGTENLEPSMTRQSELESSDINSIMARYKTTGYLPTGDEREAFFADVSEMGDYRTAMQHMLDAEAFFMSLPSELRAEFENDTAQFLDFVSNDENHDRMVEMGLLEPGFQPETPTPPVKPAATEKKPTESGTPDGGSSSE